MLTIKRITGTDAEWFAEVDALYESAFPFHEKREPEAKASALKNDRYALQAWFDGEQFIGMIGAWRFDGFTYIEHLAVNGTLRAQGYGKRMLSQFLQMHPLTILEIDPLTTEIAHKRLRFYQSLGFCENDYAHYHPSYHVGTPDHDLIVLSYPQKISEAQYERFNEALRRVVMEVAL
ncbi:GNAT family N-acetyltransferase [Dryocola sp. BD626]|uniref:GNAT family N-acetyltransferase n=1 Tax=Dryocola sp. BD626 TaxID=3133273 RepID=UPI003F508F6D